MLQSSCKKKSHFGLNIYIKEPFWEKVDDVSFTLQGTNSKCASVPVCVGRLCLLTLSQKAEMIDNRTKSRLFLWSSPSHPHPQVHGGFLSLLWRFKAKIKVAPMSQNALWLENRHWRGQEMTMAASYGRWAINHTQGPVNPGTSDISGKKPSPWRGCVLSHVTLLRVFSCRASMIPAGRKRKLRFSEGQLLRVRYPGLHWSPIFLEPVAWVGRAGLATLWKQHKDKTHHVFLVAKRLSAYSSQQQWIIDLEGTRSM